MRLMGRLAEIGLRIVRIEDLAVEEGLLAAAVAGRDVACRDAERLGRLAPEIGAVDLVDERLGVGVRLELAPADVLGDEPQVVRLEREGGVVAPELHDPWRVLHDLAVDAVIVLALLARQDVGDGHVEPGAGADDLAHLLAVLELVAPGLRLHHRHEQRAGRLRVLVDPGGAQAERLFRMLVPDLVGVGGGVSELLVDELRVPGLADAEGIHGADLHVGDHLGRRHDDGGHVLVGIDAAGREPVADPEIVRAARERHGDLRIAARRALLREGLLQRRRIETELQAVVFGRDGDRLRIEIEAGEDIHRRRHAALRHLAGRDQVGHRRQDMCAVDAVGFRAQHEIVARRAPRRLLQHFHIRQAVLGEEALLLGDDQSRRIGERDVAEFDGLRFGLGTLREGTAGKSGLHGSQRQGCACTAERISTGDLRCLHRASPVPVVAPCGRESMKLRQVGSVWSPRLDDRRRSPVAGLMRARPKRKKRREMN